MSLLRGIGHGMLARYAFGQRMLTCSAHHSRWWDFSDPRRESSNFRCAIRSLRAFKKSAPFVRRADGLDGNSTVDNRTASYSFRGARFARGSQGPEGRAASSDVIGPMERFGAIFTR